MASLSEEDVAAATQPSATQPAEVAVLPEGYWRQDFWHQMGYEAKDFGARGFWRGFKTSFWDVENAAVLAATMGASIVIRGTGVDKTIADKVKGNQQLGCWDEPIQLLGHPGTHFAAAGALWVGSTLAKAPKEHEVAKALGQALSVNGVTTLILKFAANTRAPDDEPYAWPSGHTSSSFTAAAVLNEYYGPWVGIPSLALAGLVGYQRIDSRVHDFSDVVFGAVLGYVVGSSVAREQQGRYPQLWGMDVVPYMDPYTGATGLALTKSW
jgi:membrane-associated phospholipid phosphatase